MNLEVNSFKILKEVLLRRDQLIEIVEIQKAQESTISLIVKQTKQIIPIIEDQVKILEENMVILVNQDSDLIKRHTLLTSIPGIDNISAISLMCYLPELGNLSDKQIAKFVGLTPNSKKGTGFTNIIQVRKVLYTIVLSAKEVNPTIKSFFSRLYNERNKPLKVVITACMRKLLVIANCVTRDDFFSVS